jgi:ABC-2 type transport system permease protein
MLVVTPLTFLGGAFYSVDALAEPWRTVTLFNPIVYLISGFRWTFFGTADVPVIASVAVMAAIITACLTAIVWVFRTGYRLKQ